MRFEVTPERGSSLDEALDTLLPTESMLPYANFSPIAGREPGAVGLHRGRLRHAASGPLGVLVARDRDRRPVAVLRVEHRAFESDHFGISIAQLDAPIAVPEEEQRLPALRALYRAALEALQQRGYRHVSAFASTQDRIACWVLQELGCFHVGTKISWMAPLTGLPHESELPPNLRIEVLDRATIPGLERVAWRRLHAWTATAFDRGPFVFDLAVSYDRAMAVYQTWTEKALTGEWADVLLLVRDGGEVVAFNSMMRLADLSEAAGVGVLGRGIGASLPGYAGLFTALQRECAAVRPLGAGWLENETQSSTIPTINVFGKLGHRCLRSIASFHARLDGDGAAGRRDPIVG